MGRRKSVKYHANFFWLDTDPSDPEKLEQAVNAIVDGPEKIEFIDDNGNDHTATEFEWHCGPKVLTGVLYRDRYVNLPFVSSDDGINEIPLEEGEALAEPAAFVFSPSLGACLFSFNMNGPRHPALRTLLSRYLGDVPLMMEDIVRQDIAKILKENPERRKIMLHCEQAVGDLTGDESVPKLISDVTKVTRSIHPGAEFLVEIRIPKKSTKPADKAQLNRLIAAARDRIPGIKRAFVEVAPDDEQKSELLNLFDMQMRTDKFDVRLGTRSIDTKFLASRLMDFWKENSMQIRYQKPVEEAVERRTTLDSTATEVARTEPTTKPKVREVAAVELGRAKRTRSR